MTGKVRVYELSKELNLENKDILVIAARLDIAVKSHSSQLAESEADQIRTAAGQFRSNGNGVNRPEFPSLPYPVAPVKNDSPRPDRKQQILEIRRHRATPETSETNESGTFTKEEPDQILSKPVIDKDLVAGIKEKKQQEVTKKKASNLKNRDSGKKHKYKRADLHSEIRAKFKESNRLSNFGNALERIQIVGFRCHKSTIINIESPITALCGCNGTGKSTVLHLAAAAYENIEGKESYSISDFIEKKRFDPAPFTDEARVEFLFHQPSTKNKNIKKLTIARRESRWDGYKERLSKLVHFIGISSCLPKVEKLDHISQNIHDADLIQELPVEDRVKDWMCKILSRNYESVVIQEISLGSLKEKISCVNQASITYSEFHMGFGEARSHYLVGILENLPEKSLILIEEPETSLHPSAQFNFGLYLVDVCTRKGHQVLLTTHSESLLNALPQESRIFLKPVEGGVEVIENLTASQAHSLMTDGQKKALKIFVEDEGEKSIAKIILEIIIRKQDSTFLDCVEIHPIGSCQIVRSVVKALKGSGISIAGVLDADQHPMPKENIFTLPYHNTEIIDRSPEKEIFSCRKVIEHVQEEYSLNLQTFQTSNLNGADHHEWFEKLSNKLSVREVALMTELAKVYVSTLPESLRSSLVDQLKAACQ